MDNAAEVLLIVVSTTLSIFLIVAIVATVYLIKIFKHVNHITEKAEKIADQAESVTSFFQKNAGSVAIGKMISNIVNSMKDSRKRDDDE